MDIMELLDYLDLEEAAEFEYFEHLADLLELEQEISYEACYALFSAVPERSLTELIGNYFEDIMENLPDDTVDIYTLLTTIRQCLLGLARNIGEPEGLRLFCDEFLKFHSWYSLHTAVHCKRLSDGFFTDVTVGEALALCRLEKLNGDEYDYDFSSCIDYEIDEYSMSLSEIMGSDSFDGDDETEDDDDECGGERDYGHSHDDSNGHGHSHGYVPSYDDSHICDHMHQHMDAFDEGLIDRNYPVIDGEFEDE